MARVEAADDFEGWRDAARVLAAANVPADHVVWQVGDAATDLFERLDLTEQQAIDLTHGRRIHVADREGPGGEPVAAVAPNGALVGLIEFRGKEARTLVNFPTDEAVGRA